MNTHHIDFDFEISIHVCMYFAHALFLNTPFSPPPSPLSSNSSRTIFFPSRFVVGEKSCDIFPFEFELFLNSVYWIFFLRVCSSSVQLQLPEC